MYITRKLLSIRLTPWLWPWWKFSSATRWSPAIQTALYLSSFSSLSFDVFVLCRGLTYFIHNWLLNHPFGFVRIDLSWHMLQFTLLKTSFITYTCQTGFKWHYCLSFDYLDTPSVLRLSILGGFQDAFDQVFGRYRGNLSAMLCILQYLFSTETTSSTSTGEGSALTGYNSIPVDFKLNGLFSHNPGKLYFLVTLLYCLVKNLYQFSKHGKEYKCRYRSW